MALNNRKRVDPFYFTPIDVLFPFQPLGEKGIVVSPITERKDEEYLSWYTELNSFPAYCDTSKDEMVNPSFPDNWTEEERKKLTKEEWLERQSEIFSLCFRSSNPYAYLPRIIRTHVDRNAPATNAFCKMYEMCFLEEISSLLDTHGRKNIPINIMCLAEAPGTFAMAIMYYMGRLFPKFLSKENFRYQCTTLPPSPEGEGSGGKDEGEDGTGSRKEALTDIYNLIAINKDRWHLLDHTSRKDTERLVSDVGSGTQDLVTGDIGKPILSKLSGERELFREEFGQLLSALALVKDRGVVVLKMFSSVSRCGVSMMRLFTAVFDQPRVFKPLTSRPNNMEVYWIGSGFRRDVFLPLLPSLLAVLEKSGDLLRVVREENAHFAESDPDKLVPHYPAFIDPSDILPKFSEILRRMTYCQHMRELPSRIFALKIFPHYRGWKGKTYGAYIRIVQSLEDNTRPFIEQWMKDYPISPIGHIFYELSRIPPPLPSTPTPTPTPTSTSTSLRRSE